MLMLSYWKQKTLSRFWRFKPPDPRENYFSLYFKFNYEHKSSACTCEPLLEICLETELLQALDRTLRSTLVFGRRLPEIYMEPKNSSKELQGRKENLALLKDYILSEMLVKEDGIRGQNLCRLT